MLVLDAETNIDMSKVTLVNVKAVSFVSLPHRIKLLIFITCTSIYTLMLVDFPNMSIMETQYSDAL